MHDTTHASPKPTFENEPTPVLPIAWFVAPADVRRMVRHKDHQRQEHVHTVIAAVQAARRESRS